MTIGLSPHELMRMLEGLHRLQTAHADVAMELGELRRRLQAMALSGNRAGLVTLGEAADAVISRLQAH